MLLEQKFAKIGTHCYILGRPFCLCFLDAEIFPEWYALDHIRGSSFLSVTFCWHMCLTSGFFCEIFLFSLVKSAVFLSCLGCCRKAWEETGKKRRRFFMFLEVMKPGTDFALCLLCSHGAGRYQQMKYPEKNDLRFRAVSWSGVSDPYTYNVKDFRKKRKPWE